MKAKEIFATIKTRLQKISFRTGVVIMAMCIPFYILSFAQAFLPISTAMKGVLWFILFGLAKTSQYTGLTIIGAEGVIKLKKWWQDKRHKGKNNNKID